MHTTASDGRLTPAELVVRADAAGLTTISVTDHDTVAALAETTVAAKPKGIRVISGIEITAVDHGRDVHMQGYFFDPASATLGALNLAALCKELEAIGRAQTTAKADSLLIAIEQEYTQVEEALKAEL